MNNKQNIIYTALMCADEAVGEILAVNIHVIYISQVKY